MTETNIDLHDVIADLSRQIAKLTQENAILRAVIAAQARTKTGEEQPRQVDAG